MTQFNDNEDSISAYNQEDKSTTQLDILKVVHLKRLVLWMDGVFLWIFRMKLFHLVKEHVYFV